MSFWFDMDGVLAKFLFGTPLSEVKSERYLFELPPNKTIVEASRTVPAYVLSAYFTDCDHAVPEKKQWNKKWTNIPEERQFYLPCGESKGIYYRPGRILVDDRGVHCKEWADAGGVYVKVSVNSQDAEKERTRHRFVVSPDMTVAEVLEILHQAEKEEEMKYFLMRESRKGSSQPSLVTFDHSFDRLHQTMEKMQEKDPGRKYVITTMKEERRKNV